MEYFDELALPDFPIIVGHYLDIAEFILFRLALFVSFTLPVYMVLKRAWKRMFKKEWKKADAGDQTEHPEMVSPSPEDQGEKAEQIDKGKGHDCEDHVTTTVTITIAITKNESSHHNQLAKVPETAVTIEDVNKDDDSELLEAALGALKMHGPY